MNEHLDLHTRALAAYKEETSRREAEYQAEEFEREAQQQRREIADLRDGLKKVLDLDLEVTGPTVVVDGLTFVSAGRYGLRWQDVCPICGESTVSDAFQSIVGLGGLLSLNRFEPRHEHICPRPPFEAAPHQEPPTPSASERLIDALIDVLAERGHIAV